MMAYGLPALYALFLWWFTTGLIVVLDGLPRRTYHLSMSAATALLVLALLGISWSSAQTGVLSAYVSFTCGVLVWGWQEMAFLMGFITGTRRTACAPECSTMQRFVQAVQAIVYHEIAIIVAAALVWWISWNATNQIGAWTFTVLWAMRTSAKLNLFLGVRNLGTELLPEHLRYLASFFRRKPMNLLFPFTVTGGSVLAAIFAHQAAWTALPFGRPGFTMLAAMTTLAVIEHWLLVLPLPVERMWEWGLKVRERRATPELPDSEAAQRAAVALAR